MAEKPKNLQLQSNQELIDFLRKKFKQEGEPELHEALKRFENCLEMLAHPQHYFKSEVENFLNPKK